MIKQSTCCVSKWLENFSCPLSKTKHDIKNITEIAVESPELTASYYKEYLGFRVIKKQIRDNTNCYLLENSLNFIWIAPAMKDNNGINENQQFIINTNNIEMEYNFVKEKVKLVNHSSLENGSLKSFTIKDCNGINIVYQQN